MKPCTCISCADCRGTGNIWVDRKGRYLPGGRTSDDPDIDLESCSLCRGSGYSEQCEVCFATEDME